MVKTLRIGAKFKMYEDNGNKCGKCQNHEFEVLKKGHARDCPFKKCNCLKCRLLDARSDILQVISGKETKLKGTKKDPNCGFCQNHGVKILRKGHVRSCGFGQERHFRLDNCFDCEVHYIRNEVNRLQIKMRRAMKEDRTLSEEQRKTAREAITREDVEKVCNMARLARKKRENTLTQQAAGESSSPGAIQAEHGLNTGSPSGSAAMPHIVPKVEMHTMAHTVNRHHTHHHHHQHQLNQLVRQTGVWRPWSQHQVAAAIAAQQQHQLQMVNTNNHHHSNNNNSNNNNDNHFHLPRAHSQLHQQPPMAAAPLHQQQHHHQRRPAQAASIIGGARGPPVAVGFSQQINNNNLTTTTTNGQCAIQQQQQLASAITSMAAANQQQQSYLINSLQAPAQLHRRAITSNRILQHHEEQLDTNGDHHQFSGQSVAFADVQMSPPSTPQPTTNGEPSDQATQLAQQQQRTMQEQQLFNVLFRLIVAQFANGAQVPAATGPDPLAGRRGS